jgi:antitoxin HicB
MKAFVYPARIRPAVEKGWLIGFRDFPEGISQAEPREDAIDIAEGCLQACIEGRLEDGLEVPEPSVPRPGEVMVTVPLETATKAALFAAVSASGLSRLALAKVVGLDEKEIRRMLDPRHASKLPRIARVLRALGMELHLTVTDAARLPQAAEGRVGSGENVRAMQATAAYRAAARRKVSRAGLRTTRKTRT